MTPLISGGHDNRAVGTAAKFGHGEMCGVDCNRNFAFIHTLGYNYSVTELSDLNCTICEAQN